MLDVNLPDMEGSEVAERLMMMNKNVKILALSEEAKGESIADLVKSGALGYVFKNMTIEELVNALKALARGNSYFSKGVNTKLFEHIRRNGIKERGQLKSVVNNLPITEREYEILKHIANQKTNKEIANILIISTRTVDTHRRNILQKLQVKNTAGLMKFYWENMHSRIGS